MYINGQAFCGNYNAISTPGETMRENMTSLKCGGGIFDYIYMLNRTPSASEFTDFTEGNLEWDVNTVMFAKFNGDLSAGNLILNYLITDLTSVQIKRRIADAVDEPWITIFEVPIQNESDLRFIRYDKYAQSGITYEYAYVPVLQGVAMTNAYESRRITSEFDGIFILDKDTTFNTVLDLNTSLIMNRPSETLVPIEGRYPYVVSNGDTRYYTGTCQGVFMQFIPDECDWNREDGWIYRDSFMNFLCNGKAKILKDEDGHIWIVSITDNPSESSSEHPHKVSTSFSWTEIGDAKAEAELYEFGFLVKPEV